MSNFPAPTADSSISGLHPIDVPLTLADLLIISVKLTGGYYTGKITLDQIKTFFLNNTQALEISGLASLLDGKAGAVHKHKAVDITDLETILAGKANNSHTHATGQITGLGSLLAEKANVIHTHEMSAIAGLLTALSNKANLIHAHAITDVVGLKQRLETLEEWTIGGGSNHTHQISQVVGLQSVLDGKANTEHGHNIGDVTGLSETLANKTGIGHTHVTSDLIDFQASLNGKADTTHEHQIGDVGGLEQRLNDKSDYDHHHPIDDITGLADALDSKAPAQHVQPISSITGLELVLNDKSPLNHNHQMYDVIGLPETLAEKTDLGHSHTASDVAGLDAQLGNKANVLHTHSIAEVAGLPAELLATEKTANKVTVMNVADNTTYPTTGAVKQWVQYYLSDYTYPVMSVNGRFGEVVLSKIDIELGAVDNTADMDKPVSNAVAEKLELKVDREIARFDSALGFGRVLNGDDYLIVIAKLQKQIDILMGLVPKPANNLLAVTVNERTLTITFERGVRLNNKPLSEFNGSADELFSAIFMPDSAKLLSQRQKVKSVDVAVTSNEIKLKLLTGWLDRTAMANLDSTDLGFSGTGKIQTEIDINYASLTSEDGGIVEPVSLTPIPLLAYTDLSKFDISHDDGVYSKALVFGVWDTAPVYDFVSPTPIADIIVSKNVLMINFGRDVLLDGVLLKNYTDSAANLFNLLFKESPSFAWSSIVDESRVEIKALDNFLSVELKPGWFNLDEYLDYDVDTNGKVEFNLTIDMSIFQTVSGEDLVLTRTPDVQLLVYANSSLYLNQYDVDDYLEATLVSTWDGKYTYLNIPSVPVSNLSGKERTRPVMNLVGVYRG